MKSSQWEKRGEKGGGGVRLEGRTGRKREGRGGVKLGEVVEE
jgi:hypothetical protein